MTIFEILLCVALALAIALIFHLHRELNRWRSYARRLKRRLATVEFLVSIMAIPAFLGAVKIAHRIRERMTSAGGWPEK